MAEIDLFGKCEKCGEEDTPLTKRGGKYLCKPCLAFQEDKGKPAEDKVSEFNKMIKRTV